MVAGFLKRDSVTLIAKKSHNISKKEVITVYSKPKESVVSGAVGMFAIMKKIDRQRGG